MGGNPPENMKCKVTQGGGQCAVTVRSRRLRRWDASPMRHQVAARINEAEGGTSGGGEYGKAAAEAPTAELETGAAGPQG